MAHFTCGSVTEDSQFHQKTILFLLIQSCGWWIAVMGSEIDLT